MPNNRRVEYSDSEIIDLLGGTAAVARRVGTSSASVSEWRAKGIPSGRLIELGADIERVTRGNMRRWDLRPDDWHRIWPELMGAPGAPFVEGAERREAYPGHMGVSTRSADSAAAFEPSRPGGFVEPSGWGDLGPPEIPEAPPAGSSSTNFLVGGRLEDHADLPMPINGNGPEARELVAAISRLEGHTPRREGEG